MRKVLCCLLFLVSCQSKDNSSTHEGLTDTIQSSSISKRNGNDTLAIIRPTNDIVFLGFTLGMNQYDFKKHKQQLLLTNKLKAQPDGLIYQVSVEDDSALYSLGSHENNSSIKKWMGKGLVAVEFFEDKLISISIKFLRTRGSDIYHFFEPKLNEKYYRTSPMLTNVFDISEKLASLKVGDFLTSIIKNEWILGDLNISLHFESERHKIAESKTEIIENVVLKYWSNYYDSAKKDSIANEKRAKNKEAQKDL